MRTQAGTWTTCRFWSSRCLPTSTWTSQAWRSPGCMWACVSPLSAGTSRTTGVTPSTSCTGETFLSHLNVKKTKKKEQERVTNPSQNTACLSSSGVSQKHGMACQLLQQSSWRLWWRNWLRNFLTHSRTSSTSWSPSWIRTSWWSMVSLYVSRPQM